MKFFFYTLIILSTLNATDNYQGTYMGTFIQTYEDMIDCVDGGSVILNVSSAGLVSGNATAYDNSNYDISGNVDTLGTFATGIASDGTSWSGTFTMSGVSGTFSNSTYSCGGTFHATLSSSTPTEPTVTPTIPTESTGTTPTMENTTKLYVATFSRAPDAGGLDYWINNAGLNLEGIAQSFFDQPETKVAYPADSNNAVFVEAVYQNLFNRAAETAGLVYWVEELDSGRIAKSTFILAVINGAQDTEEFGNDATILTNKTTVGLAFANAGLNDITSAKKIMLGITDNEDTVTAALDSYGLSISDFDTDEDFSYTFMSQTYSHTYTSDDWQWGHGSYHTKDILSYDYFIASFDSLRDDSWISIITNLGKWPDNELLTYYVFDSNSPANSAGDFEIRVTDSSGSIQYTSCDHDVHLNITPPISGYVTVSFDACVRILFKDWIPEEHVSGYFRIPESSIRIIDEDLSNGGYTGLYITDLPQ